MTEEQRETLHIALKLQGDLKMKFMAVGLGRLADDLACDVMDMVLTSDAVKPEIKEIYEFLSQNQPAQI